ncbi:MAG: class I SAM-dependent methyltransferase [Ruminococcus sp.]|nr:class I SAM-dependent methyltransferase [Ruminococcus sp.]
MKYYKLVLNARNPKGFWGKMMIRSMNKGHYGVTGWGLEHIEIKDDFTILDVGCGGGKTVFRLSEAAPNGKIYGIDYSEVAVKKSKKLNKRGIKNKKVQIDNSSVSNLPYNDNMFDLVTAVETYYFWPDKINDLKEIYRTLKSKGKLLLIFEMLQKENEPDKWAEVEKLAEIKAPTESEIRENLIKAGFNNVQTYIKENTTWLCAIGEKE